MNRKTLKALMIICLISIMMFNAAWLHQVNAQAEDMQKAKVLASLLNVRSEPDQKSTIVGTLERDTLVSYSQESYGWIKINSGRISGWVAGYYLQNVNAAESDKRPKTATVSQAKSSQGLKGKIIVIDPGHGGVDHGVIGKKYSSSEKTLNLKTSRYLADLLRQAGAQVIMTRTDDKENPALSERVEVSEKKRADAFISIHYNSSPKPVNGTLTFYYSKSKDEPLARKIETQLSKSLGLKSNGISFGDYHVLRENAQPSTLVELGFLSNPKDEAIVRSADYQQKAAAAIAAGLKDYFTK
ncbi:N-acetylmuramoyl-L-alanine amidase [Paenibacillus allorhizosphaerae]|uniref:SH3b domain-containing protein n=1 Tax=Paenibacillus allorhizosphaerae TaxID=2849866 RepID=A0ABN7TW73_9BACL|nr:N-acetylmuramoyl-L-alanine amidase [Paenibacillus allorhizosphaerae]CAG7654747.1 hypothetical protein PAECIP111802_05859 [Paenibacillus allorhizosphaerae]